MSVETPEGDWIKTGNGQRVIVGPGYPDDTMLHTVWSKMLETTMTHCAEQIDMLVNKVNGKAGE